MAANVSRLYEVFAERSGAKIWVERSGAGYSLLSAGAGLCNSKKLRHGCRLINYFLHTFNKYLTIFYRSNKSLFQKGIQIFHQVRFTNIIRFIVDHNAEI